ncbi:metallophosphoesterase [Rhodopseudomonas sp. HC1]|uniref:metallophosphoesterase family protein n=1 Tax=Rhodopseudomonas infernalis TaxID=2897386 RepID=UPI001EE8B64D|nr:DNA repair exonuclease [Rhodopseudomonas infernalis]MCG6205795.1 metallophosphoesterase [Rhodopseudomonas infernalis]
MRFTFIHAADLHIDSPLAGLRAKNEDVARRFAEAGRKAVQALVDETIASNAAFLIIAGDIFDGDWKDVTTGLFFVGELGALHRAGIPVFIVKGNHDADSLMSRDLPYPDSVKVFPTKAATVELERFCVALHGRSFADRVNADFVASYPARREGWLNIGVLHTSLDGTRGHEGYAPCSVDDLRRFGYDYWALGHVHAAEIVHRDPWIVFPGNLQGRSVRETGAKGAMRVTVEDGRVVDVTPLALDGARWAHLTIDITGAAEETQVPALVSERLAELHAQSDGRALAVRVTLTGATPLHGRLLARREALQDDLRAGALHLAADCWIEQLKIKTTLPAQAATAQPERSDIDVGALLAEGAQHPALATALAELTETIKSKLPRDLQDEFAASDVLGSLSDDARALLAGELS